MINFTNEKQFTERLISDLEPYTKRKVNQLPESIIKDLQKIKFGPKITSSGIEPVKSILADLYAVDYLLDEAISNPDQFQEDYSDTLVNKSSSNSPKTPSSKTAIKIKISDNDKENNVKNPKNKSTSKPSITINSAQKKPSISINIPKSNNPQNSSKDKKPSLTPPPSSNIQL